MFSEAYTGTSDSRPEYNEIIKIIKKNPGKVKYFIVRLISRMTRGEISNYYAMKAELKGYGVQLRDVSGIIQEEENHFDKYGLKYEWSVESPSETSELMEVKRAQIDRKRILRQLIEPQVLLVRDGYHIGPADDGYIAIKVDVDMKKRYVLSFDPERSNYYKEMFNLRAEGVFSDKEIVDKINAMGFKTKKRKRWNKSKTVQIGETQTAILTVKALQRIIQRYCYCGVICEKWTNHRPLKAKWDGLVSIDIFNRANRGKIYIEELGENQLSVSYNLKPTHLTDKRNKYRKEYPFKNVILCDECNQPMLASASTGKSGTRFGAYHCSRNHKRVSVSQNELEENFSNYLSKIKFDDKFINLLEKVVIKKYREEEGNISDKTNLVSKKILELKDQKQLKLRAIETTTSSIVKADLEQEYEDLHKQIVKAQNERNLLEVGEDEIHQFLKYTRDLMEHPTEILMEPTNIQEQVALYSLFFERFPTYSEILNGTPKLTLLFNIKNSFRDEKSQSVTLPGVEPGFQA